jgi:hypothetical protein
MWNVIVISFFFLRRSSFSSILFLSLSFSFFVFFRFFSFLSLKVVFVAEARFYTGTTYSA